MAQRGSYGLTPQLDLEQLQVEARHRWLRPAEICEILRNYQKFQIAPEPPTQPPSGSLFLFDRKVLRYFRKDGHNWRKKKDGKTVKEAHEKLKVGSVDVLHCYYAHGEDNENFQRRSYWMLEQDQHIVFVHYLEVKGNRTNIDGIREHDESISSFERGSPLSYSFTVNHSTTPSGNTDSTSPTSTLTALCEDADSGEIHQANPAFHSLLQSLPEQKSSVTHSMGAASLNTRFSYPSPDNLEHLPGGSFAPNIASDVSRSSVDGMSSQKSLGLASWEDILMSTGLPSNASTSSSQLGPTGVLGQENLVMNELLGADTAVKQPVVSSSPFQQNWQINIDSNAVRTSGWPMDQCLGLDPAYVPDTRFLEQIKHEVDPQFSLEHPESLYSHPNLQWEQHDGVDIPDHPINIEPHNTANSNGERDVSLEQDINYSFTARRLLSDGEEGLKKVDSFSRWVSKELGEVENLQMQSTSGLSWSTVECENVVDESSLSPSISRDQLFSIVDFSPKWAYSDSDIEVLIIGAFLKNPKEVTKCNWSCMFGEVEVPTRVLGDGLLSCRAPCHSVGVVPFYVTCSNRLACSEVREFDYRAGSAKAVDVRDVYDGAHEMHLHMRLERLLSLSSVSNVSISCESMDEKRRILNKIISLKDEEESYQVRGTVSESIFQNNTKKQVLQILLKEKLYSWLLHKVIEDGKGPCTLDEQGQGVLHLAVALGYDWTITPILAAGVSINFRDVNGWTALHWAAYCGREQTVAVLVYLGAATGLPTDPSPECHLGRTPADLASVNGHKGISGFLAESSLTSFFDNLKVSDSKEDGSLQIGGTAIVHTLSERSPTPLSHGAAPDDLSLKDSLTAVCNATQAADRIYQMFRIQSFQRKQWEYGDDEPGFDERAISLATMKNRKGYPTNGLAHTAAIQIQKKFRGWKKRKEFLTIRQRIVKIQAQWRGHQVRKQYRTIIWSVGILEKIILRWRRKGSGLRGYRSEAVQKETIPQALPEKEDDYDFLKKGRKQTEERLQKALTRVKSMVQYPEARAQYRRLLTVVEGFRENKACEMVLSSTEEAGEGEEDMLDIDSLLDDDTLMSITFE